MKKALCLLAVFWLFNCTNRAMTPLEQSITKSRTYSRKSKFRNQIVTQQTYRQAFFDLLKNKYQIDAESRRDTLILIEYYDNICFNCNFYAVSLLVGNMVYEQTDINPQGKFIADSVKINKIIDKTIGPVKDGIWELFLNKSKSNPFRSELYGSPCLDGSRATVTWILPNLNCRSIYVNCFW